MTVGAEAALLTGGYDRPYALGLALALSSQGVSLDVIGGGEVDGPDLRGNSNLNFLNLRGSHQANAGLVKKAIRILAYYVRLIRYAASANPKVFHILWNNKFEVFDRTLLMLYYKALGKKIAFTAHNVNAGKRDLNDSPLNRLTLKLQYWLADHIFVHTDAMRLELLQEFNVGDKAISVIPFGINTSVPNTGLTTGEAKRRLGLRGDEKAILFFGAIRPYKGLEYLVEAFGRLAREDDTYRLIIAGEPRQGSTEYFNNIQATIDTHLESGHVIRKIQYIPDEDTELYFKAADVLILPYKYIFQSGVLFLAYGFGLPVVATSVGAIGDEIVEAKTGFLCKPCDSIDLARAIDEYFASDLFKNLESRRRGIRDYAQENHSWHTVGEITRRVYSELLEQGN